MAGARAAFTRAESALIAAAAALVFTRVFAFSLVLPGFRAFGATLTDSDLLVGVALGAYGITMALMQLVMGVLSDRFGRRPVLLIGSLLFVAGSVWAATAPTIGTLLAARLLQGLGGVSSAALAAVGETVPEGRRTTAMAMVGIPAGAGFFLGFLAGPFAEEWIGFRGLFWATAALGLVAVLPFATRPLPAPIQGLASPGDRRSLGLPVLSLAIAGFAANFAMTGVAFYLPDADVGRWGLALVLGGALVVLAVTSRILDRSRRGRHAVVGLLGFLGAGAAVFVGSPAPLALAGGLAFFTSHAVLSAVLPSEVSRLAGRSGGRGHGIQLIVSYLGSAAGGASAGAFAPRTGLAMAAVGAVALVAALLAAVALRGGASVPTPSASGT